MGAVSSYHPRVTRKSNEDVTRKLLQWDVRTTSAEAMSVRHVRAVVNQRNAGFIILYSSRLTAEL